MHSFLMNLSRGAKQGLWLVLDASLVPLCLFVAFALRLGTLTPFDFMSSSWLLFLLLTLVGVATSFVIQLHRIKLHALERHAVQRIGLAAILLTVAAMVLSYLLSAWAPRSVPLIFGILLFCSVLG
ncbi:MAG: polysaccharide biosynthesis protein, partial [Planktotalea sp.]